jgi:hypothetical protein
MTTRAVVMFAAWILSACGGGTTKPALEIGRAACSVVRPICRAAETACAFTSGGAEDAP